MLLLETEQRKRENIHSTQYKFRYYLIIVITSLSVAELNVAASLGEQCFVLINNFTLSCDFELCWESLVMHSPYNDLVEQFGVWIFWVLAQMLPQGQPVL